MPHWSKIPAPLDPQGPFKVVWNFLILGAILGFTFIITYRMVFHTFEADGFYYALNILLFLDIGVNFLTKAKTGHQTYSNLGPVARHYLRTWFPVDALSFFPFELIAVWIYGGIPPVDSQGFQIYLALQGLTLIKLVKSLRIFHEIHEAFHLAPAVRRMLSFGYWFAQVLHFMALGWILLGAGEAARSAGDQYLRALYWVTTTVATIGYGDYFPSHDSNPQLIYTIFIQMLGVGVYSYIIANVASLVSNLDLHRAAYQKHREEVSAAMKAQKVPRHLQEKVRDYFDYQWKQRRSFQTRSVLDDLPQVLRQEILMHQNRDLLEKVEVLQHAEEPLLRELVLRLQPQIYLPGEPVIRQGDLGDSLYILSQGNLEVLVDGQKIAHLGPGSVFGEGALLTQERRSATVQSQAHGMGYKLHRRDFQELCDRYPDFGDRVRSLKGRRSPNPTPGK